MNSKLTLSLVLLAIVVVFIIQNTTVVEIHFFIWSLSMSRALMVILVLFIGMAIGWLLGSHFIRKKS